MDGELIGINGRGSFDKRGRVNSGVGYAISINQIKNFLGHLQAGIDTDHATLGAVVESDAEEGGISRMVVTQPSSTTADVRRRGLELDDEIVSLRRPADRPASTSSRTCSASSRRAGACRWSTAATTPSTRSWPG